MITENDGVHRLMAYTIYKADIGNLFAYTTVSIAEVEYHSAREVAMPSFLANLPLRWLSLQGAKAMKTTTSQWKTMEIHGNYRSFEVVSGHSKMCGTCFRGSDQPYVAAAAHQLLGSKIFVL